MKILQIGKYYYPQRGGIETHLRQLSEGMRAFANVKVIVAGKPNSYPGQIDGIDIERLAAPLSLFGAPISPGLISRLQRCNADIVHIHLPNPWAAISYLISRCRLPLVVTYHSDIIRQSFVEPAIRPVHVEFLRRASAIISTSQNLIDHSSILLRFKDRCEVIPFGADLTKLKEVDPAKVNSITQAYQKPIILAVGRLVKYKGFEYLIKAMAQVDASLIIVGKGPLKQHLLRVASDVGIAAKIVILEDVEDVTPYYHAADIFVLPSISRNEAFGIVQIEAMAAGKPVINTQLASGVPWVSLHGVTGLTVPPARSDALADAIKQLLNDPDLRLGYGKAARLRAFSEFGLAAMLSRTLGIYSRVSKQQSEILAEPLRRQATAGD